MCTTCAYNGDCVFYQPVPAHEDGTVLTADVSFTGTVPTPRAAKRLSRGIHREGRQNPAGDFIARYLAVAVNRLPWDELHPDVRATWLAKSDGLLAAMYNAGFTVPQPGRPSHNR